MKRYLAALGGALLASFVAAGVALAGEPNECNADVIMPAREWHQLSACERPYKPFHPDNRYIVRTGDAQGGDVNQDADQDNDTDQDADATAKAIQVGGVNLGLNLLSHGDLEQTNSNENEAKAENSNGTVQVIDQEQGASGGDATSGDAAGANSTDGKSGNGNECASKCGDSYHGAGGGASTGDAEGGDVNQDADQDNDTYQDADATAKAIQVGGVNLGLNVLSDGDLEQTNSNENSAKAENSNETVQVIGQHQRATGGDATSGDAWSVGSERWTGGGSDRWTGGGYNKPHSGSDASTGDAEGGDVKQDADQDNDTDQDADATAKAIQVGGANLGANILGLGGRPTLCRCDEKSSNSGLEQSNENENSAKAENSNKTIQAIGQDQHATGGSATSGDAWGFGSRGSDASTGDAEGGDVKQDADQDNDTDQDADATAKAIQVGGVNLGLNVLSRGDLEQTNSNENSAKAENSNGTFQLIGQSQNATGGDAASGDALAGLPLLG